MSNFQLLYGDEALQVSGNFPQAGETLPSFMLVDEGKHDVALEAFAGKPKVLLTLLSLDEEEHGGMRLLRATRRFLERWPHVQLLVVTVDSPSSLARTRQEHGLPGVALLSTLRGRDFHKSYGVLITDYPLTGYTSPAIWLADSQDKILYAERLSNTLNDFDFETLAKL
ncbi:MAG TPA: redoxin family protein [Chromobacteriaceae bacterium]|nr:redoxin family protein [Chromobacteriaceae bacterium]